MKTSRGFTLIELLIVMAIIGILMALLFPAVNGVINAARKAQAKNDAVQLAIAVTAFETEYGSIPSTWSDGSVGSAIINTLTGQSGNTNNPREITFMEVNKAKKGKSGTNASGDFVDPWGQDYKIAFDDDYDNRVSTIDGTITKKVAVYSTGVPETDGSPSTATNNFIRSWD